MSDVCSSFAAPFAPLPQTKSIMVFSEVGYISSMVDDGLFPVLIINLVIISFNFIMTVFSILFCIDTVISKVSIL